MNLIKPSFELMDQAFGPDVHTIEDNLAKHIELCGRTCYKSTDKITEESAHPFVQRMIDSKHYAMLEHGTVYLRLPYNDDCNKFAQILERYYHNKYSRISKYPYAYITTNLRVIIENGWQEDLQYACEPTKYHEMRHTVKFVCNRQVSHEFVRHRVFSFAQESTRYCNYTKDKFGNELTFIEPCWDFKDSKISVGNGECEFSIYNALDAIEKSYFQMIKDGWKPQQAATILPNALKTELIMTGYESDWEHFFELRALGTTGAPHPQAQELAKPLLDVFIARGRISEEFRVRNGEKLYPDEFNEHKCFMIH